MTCSRLFRLLDLIVMVTIIYCIRNYKIPRNKQYLTNVFYKYLILFILKQNKTIETHEEIIKY